MRKIEQNNIQIFEDYERFKVKTMNTIKELEKIENFKIKEIN